MVAFNDFTNLLKDRNELFAAVSLLLSEWRLHGLRNNRPGTSVFPSLIIGYLGLERKGIYCEQGRQSPNDSNCAKYWLVYKAMRTKTDLKFVIRNGNHFSY